MKCDSMVLQWVLIRGLPNTDSSGKYLGLFDILKPWSDDSGSFRLRSLCFGSMTQDKVTAGPDTLHPPGIGRQSSPGCWPRSGLWGHRLIWWLWGICQAPPDLMKRRQRGLENAGDGDSVLQKSWCKMEMQEMMNCKPSELGESF